MSTSCSPTTFSVVLLWVKHASLLYFFHTSTPNCSLWGDPAQEAYSVAGGMVDYYQGQGLLCGSVLVTEIPPQSNSLSANSINVYVSD